MAEERELLEKVEYVLQKVFDEEISTKFIKRLKSRLKKRLKVIL